MAAATVSGSGASSNRDFNSKNPDSVEQPNNNGKGPARPGQSRPGQSRPGQTWPPRLVLFDGDCPFCHFWGRQLIRMDRDGVYVLTSLQSELGQDILRSFHLQEEAFDSVLLLRNNQLFSQSDAVIEIARGLHWPWKAAVVLKWIPKAIRDGAYRFIARNRMRLMGKRNACSLPEHRDEDRIIR